VPCGFEGQEDRHLSYPQDLDPLEHVERAAPLPDGSTAYLNQRSPRPRRYRRWAES